MVPFVSADTPAVGDFTDSDQIANKEAAAVTTGIGIFEGFPDGTFRPEALLTRATGAAIIARMILGPAAVASLAGTETPFSDVPADHWASGVVAWAQENNILSGYPDGTFRPGAQLRASHFARMALCALGYGVNGEYEGSMWEVNAIVDGMRVGILSGNVDFTKIAPRNDVALYAFNMLTEGVFVTWNNQTNQYVLAAGTAPASLRLRVFPDLIDENDALNPADDLGRPTRIWMLKNEEIYVGLMTPVTVFEKDFSRQDLFRIVGSATPAFTQLTGGILGTVNTDDDQLTGAWLVFDRANPDDTAGVENIHGNENANGVRTEIYDVDREEGILANIKYKFVVIAPVFVDEADFAGIDEDDLFADVEEEDPALYYIGAEGHYFEAVTSVRGVLSRVSADRTEVTIDGARVPVAGGALAAPHSFVPHADAQTIYKDSFGNVLAIVKDDDEDEEGIAFVASVVGRVSQGAGANLEVEYFATIINTDGEEVEVRTDGDLGSGGIARQQILEVHTFVIKDGVYVFDKAPEIVTTDRTWGIVNGGTLASVHPTAVTNLTSATGVTAATTATKFIIVKYDEENSFRYDGFDTFDLATLPRFGDPWDNDPDPETGNGIARAISLGKNPNVIADIVFIYGNYDRLGAIDEFVFVIGQNRHAGPSGWEIDALRKNVMDPIITNLASRDLLKSLTLYYTVDQQSNGAISTPTSVTAAQEAMTSGSKVARFATETSILGTTLGNRGFMQDVQVVGRTLLLDGGVTMFNLATDAVIYQINIDRDRDGKPYVRSTSTPATINVPFNTKPADPNQTALDNDIIYILFEETKSAYALPATTVKVAAIYYIRGGNGPDVEFPVPFPTP
jgi:hypothetical protein